jgi:hypothetical protein
MSKPPPSYLTDQDILSIQLLRREVWVNGAYGGLFGMFAGYGLHQIARRSNTLRKNNLHTFNRNTVMASVMLGGCVCAFLASFKSGKDGVQSLYNVFQKGVDHGASPRAREARMAQDQHDYLSGLQLKRANGNNNETMDEELERNRFLRRSSLRKNMTEKHSTGLSDSHGGRWYQASPPSSSPTQSDT